MTLNDRVASASIGVSDEREALAETERLGQTMAARDARRRLSEAERSLADLIREAKAVQS